MGFQRQPDEGLRVGTWIWQIESNLFQGDDVVAELFDVDKGHLRDGIPIERIRAAIHPDDLETVLTRAQASIDEGRSYRSKIRVRRKDGLIRNVVSVGQCFSEGGRTARFAGTSFAMPLDLHLAPTLDQLTEQVILARETARALGEPFRVHLLEMILSDIGTTTAQTLMPMGALSPRN